MRFRSRAGECAYIRHGPTALFANMRRSFVGICAIAHMLVGRIRVLCDHRQALAQNSARRTGRQAGATSLKSTLVNVWAALQFPFYLPRTSLLSAVRPPEPATERVCLACSQNFLRLWNCSAARSCAVVADRAAGRTDRCGALATNASRWVTNMIALYATLPYCFGFHSRASFCASAICAGGN